MHLGFFINLEMEALNLATPCKATALTVTFLAPCIVNSFKRTLKGKLITSALDIEKEST